VIGQHDKTAKTFSHRFDNKTIAGATTAAGMYTELGAYVDMIFDKKETARHLARRLYRYFVCRQITPEIETDIIEPLATKLQADKYEILPTLRLLLGSKHFFDADDAKNEDEIVGSMIKSPLELALQSISFFNLPIPDPTTQNVPHHLRFWGGTVRNRMLALSGMNLFFPSDVAGYPAYYQAPDYNRAWFNSSSIIARYKVPKILLSGLYTIGGAVNTSTGAKLNIAAWVRNSGVISDPRDAFAVVTDLVKYLFPEEPDGDRMSYFIQDVFLDKLPASDWTYEWDAYISTNNNAEVTIALERLINALMYAPEYQLL
jgi:Protein of unknown function (DUF1800)